MSLPSGKSILRWGIGLFVIGASPLLLIIAAAKTGLLSDPNPNPVGFGILAMLTSWPAMGLIFLGMAKMLYENFRPEK